MKIDRELEKLLTLIKEEKDEDLSQYRKKMISNSLIDRRKEGVCWYPVQLERTKYDVGERLLVRVSRNEEHESSHLFQSGKMISLFSNSGANSEEKTYVTGVVNRVRRNEMMITINAEDFPAWLKDGKLGVQLLFDENTYKEMQKAINTVITSEDKNIIRLKNILLGDAEAEFTEKYQIILPQLNESQNKALNLIESAQDVAIIHGPPGTGKTTTIIQSIIQTLKHENQILVAAPSNAAVDLLVEKLIENKINVIRIGHPARVTEAVLENTLDSKITHHNNYKELKMIRKQVEEYYKLAKKYKRNFGHAEREQRRELFAEARKQGDAAKQLEYYITNDIISKAQVIAATMTGANNHKIKDLRFKTVFIDEAAQALEPANWIPILKVERVIFAGDHWQLPPTIKSFEAAKKGLENTLFEKAIQRNSADQMLQEQYRMNEKIMGFSNQIFYKNELIANEKVANWKIFENDIPLEFIDTAGCGYTEQVDTETKSTFNKDEAYLLYKHFNQYIQSADDIKDIENIKDIAIISPYKAQVRFLQETYKDEILVPDDFMKKIAVNTIDSFQGQERDLIYISLVRSNDKGKIGFLSDVRRMNVAMTRARKKLVVIGDSSTICRHKFYNQFFDYVNQIGAYRSAFEFIY